MKILAIRCKNLASLAGEQVVDFTAQPLTDAGLFAIVGPTGSGKSTLLDALCLALYNKTPRTKQRGVDSREILRRGTGDGYAEVEFVALNGNHYRSKWSVKRARNAPDGNLQNVSVELQDMTNGQLFGETPGRTFDIIENLIGLSFDQFNRAVLLAQGEFSAFLEADENKKAEILEKLTGTDLFSKVSAKIFEKNKEEKAVLERMKEFLGAIVLLTDAQREEMGARKQQLEENQQGLEPKIARTNASIRWWKELDGIQNDVQKAENDLVEAVQIKESRADQAKWLNQWDKAQEINVPLHQFQEAQTQAQTCEAELLTLTDRESKNKQELQTAETNQLQAEKDFVQRSAEKDAAMPQLRLARELDVQIKGQEEQENVARQDCVLAQTGLGVAHAELENQTALRDRNVQEKEALQAWLDGNKRLEPLARDFGLVENLLGQAQDAADRAARAEDEHAQKTRAKANAEQQLAELELKRVEADILLTDLQTQDQQLLREWEALGKNEKSINRQALEERLQHLQTAQHLFAEQNHAETELLNLQQRQSAAEAELKQEQDALAQNRQHLAIMEEALAIARKSLERSRLLVAENVESLRAALRPGDPCSVCGSTEHPFAQHLPVHEALLNEQEEAVQAHEQKRGQFQTDCAQNEARCNLLQAELVTISERIPQVKQIFQEKNRAWKESPIAPEWDRLPEQQRPGWLEGQQEMTRLDIRATDQVIARCNELEASRLKTNQQLQSFSRDLVEISAKIDLSKQAIQMAAAALDAAFLEIERVKGQYAGHIRALSTHFSEPDWENEWKKNPADFFKLKQKLAEEWRDKNDRIQKISQELIGLETSIAERQKRMLELQNDLRQKSELLEKVSQQLALYRNQRNQLFDGRSADEVEMQLDSAVNSARTRFEDHKKALADLNQNQQLLLERQRSIREQLFNHRQRIERGESDINAWLLRQTSETGSEWTFDVLLDVFSRSKNEIEHIRGELQSLQVRLDACQTVLKVHRERLDAHLAQTAPDSALPDLENEWADLNQEHENCAREITGIEFVFEQDEKNRSQVAGRLDEIAVQEAVCKNWADLNEDLGSADGNKFRKIAQGFALDTLLIYANLHLENLAKRYRLQRAQDKLDLQVVDLDMADEVRSVSSLSGGETFLVSLALALGLSSLSSDQIRVESLFIDEGFGSLDPETLATAMDALEALQNQGRKIGVISHVQEMTEKIQVQVRVCKVSKGKSRVEVVTAY